MFCPKCGQEQAAEAPNYCSRCGFQLAEVKGLLTRDGASEDALVAASSPDRLRKSGLWLLMAALVFLALGVASAANEGDASVAIFGLLTVVSFVVGSGVLMTSWVKSRRRCALPRVGQPTKPVETTQPGALLPAYVPPVSGPKARFDTGGLAVPASITENTTRHMQRESSSDRGKTR